MDLLEKTYELMHARGMTFREARSELAKRGALVRARNVRRRREGREQLERMKIE